MYQIQLSTANYPLVFKLVSSSDHVTGLTGAAPSVVLSKSGGAFAAPVGAVSEIGNGWYKVAGNGTDTATVGPLVLHATATSADPSDVLFEVVAVNPQSATYGLAGLTLAAVGLDGITVESGLNARQALAIIAAAVAGSSSGVDTGSPIFNGAGVTAPRITATASVGNRSAVTLTPPA